jgi:hypothetical protein
MAIFASQAQNFDPEPWVSPDGWRFDCNPIGDNRFDPRPEYGNRVNPVLVEFRRFCGSDEWNIGASDVGVYADSWVELIDLYDRDHATWGPLWTCSDDEFDHARRVLQRLANLLHEFEENVDDYSMCVCGVPADVHK